MKHIAARALALAITASVTAASLGLATTQANAGVHYASRAAGGFRMEHRGFGMDRRGFGRADLRRGDGRGFDLSGANFGDGRVAAGLGAATLALGIFGAVAQAAADQQAAQPRCGSANQPVLRPNGTYYYRRVQVCQ